MLLSATFGRKTTTNARLLAEHVVADCVGSSAVNLDRDKAADAEGSGVCAELVAVMLASMLAHPGT